MSKIEQSVCEKILQRAKVGKEKYGTTMERDDLTFQEWITHLQEELMDAIVYIEKLKQNDANFFLFYGENEAEYGNPIADNSKSLRDKSYYTYQKKKMKK